MLLTVSLLLLLPALVSGGPGLAALVVDAPAPRVAARSTVALAAAAEVLAREEPFVDEPGPPDTVRVRTRTGSTERTAWLHLPCRRGQGLGATACDPGPGPYPLVVAAHGGGGHPAVLARDSGFSALADRERFAVVYPLGPSWNAGTCCSRAVLRGQDDAAYLDALVAQLRADPRYAVDATRAYFTGVSNGGMLAMRLNCRDRGPFLAFASVNAAPAATTCGPPQDVRPHLLVNGTGDVTVPLEGCLRTQLGSSCENLLRSDLAPVSLVLDAERGAAGCTGTRTSSYGPRTTRVDSVGCTRPGPVQLVVQGAGHGWAGPGTGRSSAAALGLDEDYTTTIWRFFRNR